MYNIIYAFINKWIEMQQINDSKTNKQKIKEAINRIAKEYTFLLPLSDRIMEKIDEATLYEILIYMIVMVEEYKKKDEHWKMDMLNTLKRSYGMISNMIIQINHKTKMWKNMDEIAQEINEAENIINNL